MFLGFYLVFCALNSLHLTNGATTKKKVDYSTIIFPGPIQDLSNRYGTPNISDRCKNQNFCTVKPDDYPEELFNNLFKGKFKEPVFQPTYVMTDDRQGDPDDMDNCDSTVVYEPLYNVKTRQGDWRTVVQAPKENYVQMVRLETCNEVGSVCFTEFKVPLGLQPFCKQKYSVWEFLVHDGNDGTEKIKVDLPICCSCHYKKT
nr:uncharacterized protein LOC110384033 [Helicoverpa armigera]